MCKKKHNNEKYYSHIFLKVSLIFKHLEGNLSNVSCGSGCSGMGLGAGACIIQGMWIKLLHSSCAAKEVRSLFKQSFIRQNRF